MNYHLLFDALGKRRVRIAVTGASGGFARSLLAQCRAIPAIDIVALCDLNTDGTRALLSALRYRDQDNRVCTSEQDVRRRQQDGELAIISDYQLLSALEFDTVVEATGKPEVSIDIAVTALKRGIHVGMVSKETDSVAGPWLNRLAAQHNAVYTTVDGDQPSNLIGLYTWAKVLGLEVIAAGKSSEYDYIYHQDSGRLDYTDKTVEVPQLSARWSLPEQNVADTRCVCAAKRWRCCRRAPPQIIVK
ncbi:hypothetical protein [Candidatus Sodalis endolongispinus]|uniref:hypothetical protein n=1 Tax=Candidatus Sodalis endolongispinus TaxID=2812662 RepID=UPI001C00CA63|nr:hypothetical protein [Candidatus Sodalis endolongispinus]